MKRLNSRPMRKGLRRWATAIAGVACFAVLGGASAPRDGLDYGGPPQMRRITESQYRASIADIFGTDIKVAGRFSPDLRIDGLLAVGTSQVSLTPPGVEYSEALARSIAAQVVDDAHYDRLVGCKPGGTDPDGRACAKAFFERVGLRLFRRPLDAQEVSDALALLKTGTTQVGEYRAALAAALTSLLNAPDFLFRIDHVVANGRQLRLDGYSKAARLSYFLWNTTPDADLLAAAGRGELDTEAGVARQIERMTASPRLKDGVRAFFTDFLRLDGLAEVTKDAQLYPSFTSGVASASREQTLRTIVDLFVDRGATYNELFTTRRIAMNRVLSPLFGVPAPAGWSSYEFGENDPHAGLLTQVAFLAQYSHPGRSSPTLRGKALREILMCEHIPAPPANVSFAVVQDIDNPTLKTARQRVRAHLDDEECASCHKLTDPLGLALETFDAAGQFRTTENGEPIDASAEFNNIKFDGAKGAGQALASDPRVPACLVKSMYRYANGRDLLGGEQKLVDGLTSYLTRRGLRIPELMRTIANHPAFFTVRKSAVPGHTASASRGAKGDL